jgi:Mg2+-importing ATPase
VVQAYWSHPAEETLAALGTSREGLRGSAVRERLRKFGPNAVVEQSDLAPVRLLLKQFGNPLVLILIFGAGVSLALRQWVDAGIILAIVLGSGLLGFRQEYRASQAVAELRRRLTLRARVLRDGRETPVPVAEIVPGDVLLLSAGSLVPADGLVLEAQDFLVTEASLTGESFPVEKLPGIVPADAPVGGRTNAVFMGSSVRSGTARVVIVETGARTGLGAIAARLKSAEPETDFARGVRRFGAMLVRLMMLIVILVLAANQMLGRPFAESLLFSVALAVGLSPELLPAIVTVTLSAGARELAKGGVIVRRLEAIENLGSMEVLCCDKTGTLTEGSILLEQAIDPDGHASEMLVSTAFLNSSLETGIDNPIDAAVIEAGRKRGLSLEAIRKVAEIPYDFERRRLTIVVADERDAGKHRIVSKGAFENVLAACSGVVRHGEERELDAPERARLREVFRQQSEAGYRVLGLAERRVPPRPSYGRADESGLAFTGMLLLVDPPKTDAGAAISELQAVGVEVKIISGDNRFITAHVAKAVGLDGASMMTGAELVRMSNEALWYHAPRTTLFVEIDPQQKERIVRALQHGGRAVGYLGDGINDAPALHAADVGISVDGAVDVARESADIVLLKSDLGILRRGVADGRRTFANTLKYISITTSANFGNMVSMAVATPLLPFLPLLPKQILLNNFLSDLPSMAISSDKVDAEQLAVPQRWDVREVRRFMILFGLISSFFDLLTFAALLVLLHAGADLFRTVWFTVSLLTELGVVLVLRTRKPVLTSRPSNLLLLSTIGAAGATLAMPFLGRWSGLFGFTAVDSATMLGLSAIVLIYLGATEVAKRRFYRRERRWPEWHPRFRD